MELAEILRVAGMCLMFCEEGETTGVFIEWIKKAHTEVNDGKECGNENCQIANATIEKWQEYMHESVIRIGRLLVDING